MRLTKRQSRFLAVFLLASFFAGTGALIQTTKRDSQVTIPEKAISPTPQVSASHATSSAALPPVLVTPGEGSSFSIDVSDPAGAQMVLKNFKRKVTKGAAVQWEVEAEEGRYRPNDGGAELKNATLLASQKDGSLAKLTAQKALLIISGQDLTNADLSGGVTVQHQDVKLKTEHAIFNNATQKVHAPSPVSISTSKVDATGDTMDADLNKSVVILRGNVVTVVKPDTNKKN